MIQSLPQPRHEFWPSPLLSPGGTRERVLRNVLPFVRRRATSVLQCGMILNRWEPVTALECATCFPFLQVAHSGTATMHEKKPDPLPAKPRRLCPVCGMVSYSAGGTHPQCAEEQSDAARVARLKKVQKTARPKARGANPNALSPWQKRCPKCHNEVHIRKLACGCGYQFSRTRLHQ